MACLCSFILIRKALNLTCGRKSSVIFSARSTGESSSGRLFLDGSKDLYKTLTADEAAAIARTEEEESIFREDENPLIAIEEFELTNEFKTFEFESKVPVGAKSLVLRFEPRAKDRISAGYVIDYIKVIDLESGNSIINNSEFESFSPLKYEETLTNYGGNRTYQISAIYELEGMKFESFSAETTEIELVDKFAPPAPRSLRAQAALGSVTVTWNASRASDLAGYNVYRKDGAEGRWKKVTSQPVTQTLYRDRDVKASTVYFYRIEAIDKAGNKSEMTSEVEVETLN